MCHAEHVLVELLDDRDQPVPSGEAGRVVLTTLQNFQNPMIRYEVGDIATGSLEPCRCGRGLPVLDRVMGWRTATP